MAAILFIDVLDHLFTALMLKIDVDVGWLVAFLGDKTLEQYIDLARVDGSDFQAVTDHGIGGRTPPLVKDVLRFGETHDVLNGQEGDDVLIGGRGNDIFHLSQGNGFDRIRDFVDGEDKLNLGSSLNFSQISISQVGSDIRISASNDLLAVLEGVSINSITLADFV